ncbi:saccharopine dehydrogenase NADP-binding domain-containing protein [Actinomadura sp. LOL_016]|uniref:saccharopine dehydrogenase NADP-binding domain-containing protein n=1 Tax=unclassified Actinomadura TaxID=2626254 RepID=UPI003A7FC048
MIGLIGASGAVGGHAARLLSRHGKADLRLGVRRPEAVAPIAADLPGGVEVVRVDVTEEASLAAFARDCAVVANCAGPAQHLAEAAALTAWRAGADYVDAGGDATTAERVARGGAGGADRRAVFAAGAWPGLSGLLPRWLAAREFTAVHTLTAYIGVRDRFTATAAADYLDGVLDGASEPLAAWRQGPRSRVLTRLIDEALPFFPEDVSAFPYLDHEGEQVARALDLTRADWYSVLPGTWGVALDSARTRPRGDAVADLCRAADLDAAGHPASTTMLTQLDGEVDGVARTRTGLLQGPGVSELTGAVTAVATLAVLGGAVAPGATCAATALDPPAAVTWLGAAGVCRVTVLETSVAELRAVEEGAL